MQITKAQIESHGLKLEEYSKIKILLSIIGAASFFGCSSAEQMQRNEKVEPAHTIAIDLKESTICEVYMVDDSYPNGQQIKNGEPLHGYGMLSKPITLPKNNREDLMQVLKRERYMLSGDLIWSHERD